MRIALLALALAFAAAPASPGTAGTMELTNPLTGQQFNYRPSFSPKPQAARRTRTVFDGRSRKWVQQGINRKELEERRRMRYARALVTFNTGEAPGTIVVDTEARYLYRIQTGGVAIRYGVGVGREGFTWSGVEKVSRKAEWPAWTPPAEMRERQPELPEWMPGGPGNPLGAAALYLGSTLYRIHGTTQESTIGGAVSSGCIRMLNEDIADLYARTPVGAKVIVFGPQSDRSQIVAATTPF
ncbi:L,D-transpeptidase [Acuticoccus sp. MNP-M23]|uniref:L,D-transpeptidase n=1 Tax=Acuticoccus sp. MNP-M23 TaxID=3072793 RepID=UPI002815B60D|nr:L,D-transpeptidase [Acuticoccus sp. MNP-M23]WMS44091.1 L,D-transpeptidase [Acuticoccus sp. MNP-M23]